MRLIINKLVSGKNKSQGTIKEQPNKYRFYNLLFSGRISMKEYLNALHYLEESSKRTG